MITTEIKGGKTHIMTDGVCLIHTASGRRCGRRTYLMPGETVEDYHDEAEEAAYTEAEYKAKVAELIHERYDADEETGLINNMLDENPTEEHIAEYRAYQAYRAECKVRAVEELTNAKSNIEDEEFAEESTDSEDLAEDDELSEDEED